MCRPCALACARVRSRARIGCSRRSGLMSTGCCHTPLPLLINWLLVAVWCIVKRPPPSTPTPPPVHPPVFFLPSPQSLLTLLFWQQSFKHFFVALLCAHTRSCDSCGYFGSRFLSTSVPPSSLSLSLPRSPFFPVAERASSRE